MMLDPKGLEAAYDAGRDYVMEMDDRTKQMLRVSITAYLSTVTPAEAGGLVERLTMMAGIIEMGERIAWGSDTAIMREAATALAAQEAELDRLEIAKREAVAGWREAETRATANHSLAVANGTRAREEHDRAERALGRKA